MITGNLAHEIVNNFIWMGWNILLGAVPLWLSMRLFEGKQKLTPTWIVGCIIFIVFLPNAAYILTDIIHLFKFFNKFPFPVARIIFIIQFVALECIGYWLFVESYRRFERFFVRRLALKRTVLRIVSFFAISIGVSIGRFAQLNSWDVFVFPNSVLETLTTLVPGQVAVFTVLFTVLLFLLYAIHEHVVAKTL